jgi:UDP-3-O-[3-hydroxymyristoyl] glucosamine N-acyltransferase
MFTPKVLLLLPLTVLLASPVSAAGWHHRPDTAAYEAVLTPEQKAGLAAAREAYKAKRAEVMSSLSEDQKKKLAELRSERREKFAAFRSQAEAILTPEQRARLEQAKAGKDWRSMTAEERAAFRTVRREVAQSLTGEQWKALHALPRSR